MQQVSTQTYSYSSAAAFLQDCWIFLYAALSLATPSRIQRQHFQSRVRAGPRNRSLVQNNPRKPLTTPNREPFAPRRSSVDSDMTLHHLHTSLARLYRQHPNLKKASIPMIHSYRIHVVCSKEERLRLRQGLTFSRHSFLSGMSDLRKGTKTPQEDLPVREPEVSTSNLE